MPPPPSDGLFVLGARAVREALPMKAAIDAMRAAFVALADGTAVQPHRMSFPVGSHGTSAAMGAYVPGLGLTGKLVMVFPGNKVRGLPGTQALCVVFDPDTGTPRAMIEGTALTARRTGAAAGLATRLLARQDARVGAVVGCGVTGREQVLAIDAVRELDEIRIAARRKESAARCVEAMQRDVRAHLVAAPSPAAAARGADIVCAATSSIEPVLRAADLAEGCHVNTVGSFRLDMRELDPSVFAGARVFVDRLDAACAEAGHLVAAERAGVTRRSDWTMLGDVVRGAAAGRGEDGGRTVFVSVGQAAQDVAAAARILAVARERGLGSEIDLT